MHLRGIGIFFLITTVFGAYAPAQVACNAVFRSAEIHNLGVLKPWFLAAHNTKYTVENLGQSAVKNQGALGVCHIFSIVSQFEHRYQQRTGRPIELSQAFLTHDYWMRMIAETLESDKPVTQVNMGGSFLKDWNFIRASGLLPAEAWAQNGKFNQSPSFQRVEEYTRNILDRAILKASTLKGPAKQAVLTKATNDAEQLVNQLLGVPPTEFQFEGRTYSPQSFAKEFFPELQQTTQSYVVLNEHQRIDGKIYEVNSVEGGVVTSLALNEAETMVKSAIDSGANVYLAFESNQDFMDHPMGIMTIAGFGFPAGGGPLSRSLRFENKIQDGGHSVQVVGYDLDPATGKVIKFKVKNSWGLTTGDSGYYHMYLDYFRAFVTGFSVF